ncbi:MAG: hypothetical protein KME43_01390 [Myxacorys chilensis ATA2-1-KO14]|jgi:WD40 repeat protein|nr:hypothetical protein [Myxacorys chilensis ATA2-1-KO14]
MDLEQALAFTDQLVFAKAGTHLSDLQQAMLRESWSWQRQSYDKIADTYGYSPTYLKHDIGPKLWRLLSSVLDEKVNKTSFRAAIERRFQAAAALQEPAQALVEEPIKPIQRSSRQDWGEQIDISFFYGREAELGQLQQWILDERCRLVAILSMGGMGKTSLTMKLAQQLQPQFERVIWRSLRNAPPLVDLLADWLHVLSDVEIADSEPVAGMLSRLLAQLLTQLRSQRCLLILDNVETVLPDPGSTANPHRSGYEGYGELFRQIGETLHQSTLVLTSREKPQDISVLEGAMLPVRCFYLNGLQPRDGQALLQLKGAFRGTDEEWNRLIEGYSGNPLALKIIATTIQNLFDGSISDFLQQDTFVFGTIRSLIEQQFERLSEAEKTVMYWLAIYRESATFSDLRSDIFPPIAPQALMEILQLLEQRSLVERTAARFSLLPLMLEYVSDRLIDHVCQELKSGLASQACLVKRHALLTSQAKDYIRDTQIRLILAPILMRLEADLVGQIDLKTLFTQSLKTLQGKSSLETGYAGGNLLNLLCQLTSRLEDLDCSNLKIWQAYLKNVELHDVDLSDSDLSHSIFTDTLGIIFSVAFSPDGTLLATGDAEGGLRLWDVANGTLLLNCSGHVGWIWAIAFSPDGQTLASCSSDKTIRLWDLHTGRCSSVLEGHTGSVWSVAFCSDGKTLASGGDESTVRLWDISTGDSQLLPGHTGRVLSVAFSRDGQTLASGSDDRSLRIWSMHTKDCQQICEGHRDRIWSIAFLDDTTIASGSADHTINLWNCQTGACLKTLQGHRDRVRSIAFDPAFNRLISASDDRTIRVWDLATGDCLSSLRGHTNAIFSLSLNRDGETLASGSTDQSVKLWNLSTSQCLKTLSGYTNSIFSIAFKADGQQLVSGSTDQAVRLWDTSTGACLNTFQGHRGWVTSVAFHPNGRLLASGSVDRTIRLWDLTTGQCRLLEGHANWVQSVVFSPDGQLLVSGSDDQTVRIWAVDTGVCLQTLQGHTSWVWAVAFSPDGTLLASSSEDQTIRLWSMQTGTCLHTLQGHTGRVQSIAFHQDGQVLASGSGDETVRLWSTTTGQCLNILEKHQNSVWSVAFSPNAETLASGSLDQTIKLWQMETGACLKTLPMLTQTVRTAIAFHPDPNCAAIASGSQSGTITIWDTQTGQCLKILAPTKPYTGTNITRVTGITVAQKSALLGMGAIES